MYLRHDCPKMDTAHRRTSVRSIYPALFCSVRRVFGSTHESRPSVDVLQLSEAQSKAIICIWTLAARVPQPREMIPSTPMDRSARFVPLISRFSAVAQVIHSPRGTVRHVRPSCIAVKRQLNTVYSLIPHCLPSAPRHMEDLPTYFDHWRLLHRLRRRPTETRAVA
jgi:hypothetical protein